MNKILLTIIGLAAGLTALAQGTVNLNNSFKAPGATEKAFVLGLDNKPLLKANGSVEVLDASGNLIKGGGFGADGLFFLNLTEIPGAVGLNTTKITIRAWDNTTGSTYDTATVSASTLVNLDPTKATPPGYGAGLQPGPQLGAIGDFTGLSLQTVGPIVPEPSTYALAALGLAGMFFVARRK